MKETTAHTIRFLFITLSLALALTGSAQVSSYSFSQVSGTYTAITGGTVLGDAASDDEVFVDPTDPTGLNGVYTGTGFPIGFNFSFNNIVFNQVAVSYNGWISLGQSSLTPAVDINSTSAYSPLASTTTNTPAILRNRIAGFARDLEAQTGSEVRIQTIGTAPNRVCVIQWSNLTRYLVTGDNINFQIRLNETSNRVDVVYQTMTLNTATTHTGTTAPKVGLGGTVSTDFNSRTTTTSWLSTTASAANDAGCDVNTGVTFPTSGTTFRWTPPANCSGTPTAGTTTALPTSVCATDSFNLSISGVNSGFGITYQWISSTNGTAYSYIAGATSNTYRNVQAAATFYRCIVTCTASGLRDTSTAVQILLNSGVNCYCTPPASNCNYSTPDQITNVTFAGINNTTTCGTSGYSFYNSLTANVILGSVYPMSVAVTNGGTEYVAAWIDYNHDGTFSATEFTAIGNGTGGVTFTNNITIPLTALTGVTRMRVRDRYNTALTGADACLGYSYGETEDYLINITSSTPCTTPTEAGVISGPTTGACDSFYLYTTNTYVGNLQWQYSTTGTTGPWTDLAGSTNDSVALTAAAAGTYYIRLYATQAGCSDDSSNVIALTLTKLGDAVCSAVNLSFGANGPYYVEGATTEVGEVVPPAAPCYSLNGWCPAAAAISNTLWFKFTAPASGRVRLQAPDFDAQLAVWDAPNCGSLLSGGATLLAANDDDSLFATHGSVEFSPYIDSIICLTPGKTYYVQLDPFTADDPSGTEIILTDLGAGPNAAFTNLASTYCTGAAPVTLVPVTSGGVFSGPGVSGNVFTPANAGVGGPYVITYTFYACYKSSDTVTSIASGPSVSLFSATNVACFGGNTGAVDMNVGGGSGNFTYNWSNGTHTQDLTGVAAGNYTLSVIDNIGGCTAVGAPVTLTQPLLPITPALDSIVNVKCFGGNSGGIYVTVSGGTSPYTYLWSNGSVNQDLTGVASGAYQGTITDANSCTYVSQQIPVSQASALVLVLDSVKNNNCGGTSTGGVYVTLSGGTTPYTYNWSNGATSQDITGLSANVYTVSAHDANSCTVAPVSGAVVDGASLVLTLDSVTNSACAGAITGGVYVTVSGGSIPYTYNWSNGTHNQDLTGVGAGTYTISVNDGNGCTATPVSGVVANSALFIATLDSTKNTTCAGANNGGVYITLTGGSLPFTYNWSNGTHNQDLTSVGAGSYTVSVNDGNGCTVTPVSGTVTDGVVNITVTLDSVKDVTCSGLLNGSIGISVSGGAAGYGYLWTGGATTQDVTALAGGNYTVTVNDANNCTTSFGPIGIAEPATIVFTLDSVKNVNCFGNNTGAVFTTGNGGTAPTTLIWSNSQTAFDLANLSAGSYSATLTDANGCSANVTATVTQPTAALSGSATTTDEIQGGTLGSVNLTPAGGTAPYTYNWSNGTTTEDLAAVSAGSYSCTITDANGCSYAVSATVSFVTGVENVKDNFSVSVYPNPTQNNTLIELNLNTAENVTVEIYNLGGQLVRQFAAGNVLSTKFEVNFSNEAAGVYYAKVKAGDANATIRIVVTN